LKFYSIVSKLSGYRKVNVGASPAANKTVILQEFQYGKDVFQTTTTNVSVSGGCVISCLKTSFVGYGNIE